MKTKKKMKFSTFLKKNGRIIFGGAVLTILILTAIFADFLIPYDPNQTDFNNMYQLPNEEHLLGTDCFGRDMLSRLIYGTRITLILAFGVQALVIIGGACCGLLCGYYKKVDTILMRFMEGLHSLPATLLTLVVASALGAGTFKLIISLAICALPAVTRMTRSQVLSIRKKEFIECEKTMGAKDGRIIFRHILPSCSHYLAIRFTTGIAGTILTSSSLAYLGVGLDPAIPSWGAMIADGQGMMLLYPHLIMSPGIVIAVTVFACSLFGEGIREKLDPRLR